MITSGTTITADLHDDWLVERNNSIGASEAPGVCSVSDYDTPLSIYLRKVGLEDPRPVGEAAAWGLRLEGVIAEAYSERTGHELIGAQKFVRSELFPFMTATIDRIRHDGQILELKTIGSRAASAIGDQLGEDGSDVVPLSWRIQVTHQMVVAGRECQTSADIAALIGGQDFRVFTVPFDERVAARMVEIEREFWDRVERRDPPPVNPERDGPSLRLLYPDAVGEIDLPPEIGVAVAQWEAAKEAKNRATKEADEWRDRLMAEMGGAASGTLPDGRLLVRKIVNRKAYSVAASSHPELRITKGR